MEDLVEFLAPLKMHDKAVNAMLPGLDSTTAKAARTRMHEFYTKKISALLADKESDGLAEVLKQLRERLSHTSLRMEELFAAVEEAPASSDEAMELDAAENEKQMSALALALPPPPPPPPQPLAQLQAKAGKAGRKAVTAKKRVAAPTAVAPSAKKAAGEARAVNVSSGPLLDDIEEEEEGDGLRAMEKLGKRGADMAGVLLNASQIADKQSLPEFSALLKMGAAALGQVKHQTALLVQLVHRRDELAKQEAAAPIQVQAGGEGSRVERRALLESDLRQLIWEKGLFAELFPKARYDAIMQELSSESRPEEAVRKNCSNLLKDMRQSFSGSIRSRFATTAVGTAFPSMNKEQKVMSSSSFLC